MASEYVSGLSLLPFFYRLWIGKISTIKMSQSRRINELSLIISKNTAVVDSFLESSNLATPTLGVDAPSKIPIPEERKDVETARMNVIEASAELRSLMMGPSELLHPGVRCQSQSWHWDQDLFLFTSDL